MTTSDVLTQKIECTGNHGNACGIQRIVAYRRGDDLSLSLLCSNCGNRLIFTANDRGYRLHIVPGGVEPQLDPEPEDTGFDTFENPPAPPTEKPQPVNDAGEPWRPVENTDGSISVPSGWTRPRHLKAVDPTEFEETPANSTEVLAHLVNDNGDGVGYTAEEAAALETIWTDNAPGAVKAGPDLGFDVEQLLNLTTYMDETSAVGWMTDRGISVVANAVQRLNANALAVGAEHGWNRSRVMAILAKLKAGRIDSAEAKMLLGVPDLSAETAKGASAEEYFYGTPSPGPGPVAINDGPLLQVPTVENMPVEDQIATMADVLERGISGIDTAAVWVKDPLTDEMITLEQARRDYGLGGDGQLNKPQLADEDVAAYGNGCEIHDPSATERPTSRCTCPPVNADGEAVT